MKKKLSEPAQAVADNIQWEIDRLKAVIAETTEEEFLKPLRAQLKEQEKQLAWLLAKFGKIPEGRV